MCGISGAVLPNGSTRTLERPVMERMRDVLAHRGPDDSGLFLEPGVALGHRRLSIIDVAAGHQPMFSADGRYCIVYNGEIFNHPTLKQELEQQGVVYRTRCDTETVLHLHAREGLRGVQRLRGMFAIALWDRHSRELCLVRDRFGVKPLYYYLAPDGGLYFASEIKALLESGAIRPELNRLALPDFLANHATSGDDTLFQGIRRLPPGHTLRWREGRIEIERYWDLTMGTGGHRGRPDHELVAEYRDRLTEAVRLRLMSDVPLGVFLSGGIDSAAITALMSQLIDEPVKSFSVAFAEREADELAYARLVSQRFGTEHHEIVVSPEQFFTAVPRLVWHEDEPMAHPSSVALNFVSRLAAEHVKVVLTGEGSDETLAGYNRYRVTMVNATLGRGYERVVPRAVRGLIRGGVRSLPGTWNLARRLGRTFLALPADLDTLYFDNFSVFSRSWQARLLTPALQAELSGVDPYADAHAALERRRDDVLLDQLLYSDTKTYLHELLMKQDQMSMAASIESRVPFLDHPLVEWAARLPAHLKLRGLTTKVVLREAMRGILPPEILTRKKMGFPVPIGRWLRGPYRHLLTEFLLGERVTARGLFEPAVVRDLCQRHLAGEGGHAERLWALLNFEIWQRVFFDGEPVEDVLTSKRALAGVA